MVLSKREKYVGILVVVVLGILLLDRIMITPLLERKAELNSRIEAAQGELDRANRVFSTSRLASRKWKELAGNSLKTDPSEAESQILNSVREWAQDAGMALPNITPERTKEKDFGKIVVRASGTGGISQVGHFLWRVQTAGIPVRITNITITTHKEGTDDLSVQFAIATLYLLPEPAEKNAAHSPTASVAWEAVR
jgi:hypothetical protein